MSANRIRWAYAPLYRDYTNTRYQQSQHLSHFFDLEGTMQVGGAVKIALRDHVVRDTLQLAEADRGGEVFSPTPFITQSPEMQVEWKHAILAAEGAAGTVTAPSGAGPWPVLDEVRTSYEHTANVTT